jgi:hypothetical protein
MHIPIRFKTPAISLARAPTLKGGVLKCGAGVQMPA